MVRIPPGLWPLEGQKKKFFPKKSVAKAYKDRLARRREETKSLLLLLHRLWAEQNLLLAGLIGVFGIAIPLLKTTCQLLPDSAG